MMQTPPPMPDNGQYFHAAYVIVALLYGGYALALWRRMQRARARLQAIRRRESLP